MDIRGIDVLVGSFVSLVGFPLVVGPVAGGWLAGRRSDTPLAGGALAGLFGGLQWGGLVYLAASGTVPEWGYHRGGVHLGVNAAPPGLLAPWQAVGIALSVVVMVVGLAAGGGGMVMLARVCSSEEPTPSA